MSAEAAQANPLMMESSRQFPNWLEQTGGSLCFTTYQAGKIFFIGLGAKGLSVFERTLERCMGMCVAGDDLFVSTLYTLWRFRNVLPPGQLHDGYDRLFVPRTGHVTGDIDIHDIARGPDGKPVFVSTLFSCIATVSETDSFTPVWRPPHVTRLAAEDRCHLNGMAMKEGAPAFATAVSTTDVADGWREHRRDGGVVMDVPSGEVVAGGLSMPHSPRLHQGRLFVLNAGSGELGEIGLKDGRFTPIAFCPGYLRGLSFVGNFAIVGSSKLRDNRAFTGLALDDALAKHKVAARCGLFVIDLATGDVAHWLKLEGLVEELYDVAFLPGARRPMAIGFKNDEIRRVISVGEGA